MWLVTMAEEGLIGNDGGRKRTLMESLQGTRLKGCISINLDALVPYMMIPRISREQQAP
jgi:hypothetical protein